MRLKQNIQARVANTEINSQSNMNHDANASVDKTKSSENNTSNKGLEYFNHKRFHKDLNNIHKKLKKNHK